MTETYQVGQGNERAYIMGEIKSTLEIIMEKTKGMTLSFLLYTSDAADE